MKILLAYDGFEHSEPALEETVKLAQDGDAEIVSLSVVPPDARGSKAGGHVGMAPHAHEHVALARAYLRARGIASEMRIEHGDPAEEILKEARRGRYDLVVMGTRGRGPVVRVPLGSVSNRVAANARCTVLIAGEDVVTRVEPRVVVEPRVPA
jgi:nucleotide-binding universal stress UspA family protein